MADEGFFVAADGVRLRWRALGSGPTVVVPNGLYFLDDLAELGERLRLVAYDPRNRGESDAVADAARLGIERDVEDLEAVRSALGEERLALVGHSYVGFLLGLYATRHPDCVRRLVQIGPLGPDPGREYPPELRGDGDGVAAEVFAALRVVQAESEGLPAEERCERLWAVLRRLYVADAAHAARIRWGRCHLANERGFLRYWLGVLLPSIQARALGADELAAVAAPALVIHGRRDRSAPWSGGRDWVAAWPHATLLTVEDAAHAPWLERPGIVLPAMAGFLAGDSG